MKSVNEKCGIKLSDDLKYWRAERPDEWTMDRFIQEAEKLEQQLQNTSANSDYSKCYNCGCSEKVFFDKKSDIDCGVEFADIIVYVCKKCKRPVSVELN